MQISSEYLDYIIGFLIQNDTLVTTQPSFLCTFIKK